MIYQSTVLLELFHMEYTAKSEKVKDTDINR